MLRPLSALLLAAACCAAPSFAEEPPVVTPDQPGYVGKLVQEQLDLALAANPPARLEKLSAAGHQRVLELKAVVARKHPELLAVLVDAYGRTAAGVEELVQQAEQDGLDLAASLSAMEKATRRHPAVLEELSLQVPPDQEAILTRAVETAKKHQAAIRKSLDRARKARGSIGGAEGGDSGADAEGADAPAEGEGLGFDLHDVKKPKSGESSGGGDERRKGRGD